VIAGLLSAFMSTFSGTVNCGASYVVNDIYRRYINPGASSKFLVWLSYIASVLMVGVGVLFGLMTESIHSITQWIVAGLWGGYTAPNVLKWYWWRLNGVGYFCGMVAGMAAAMIFPIIFPGQHILFGLEINLAVFPFILVASLIACVVASLLTPPDDDDVLIGFYKQVRPWGFWKPIHDKVVAQDNTFVKNTAFKRDMVNVLVGIVWQLMLVIIPIYLVIKQFDSMGIAIVILVLTSVFLRFNWYNKLERD
jgi:SSS family solute:Na+ symporter